MNGLLNQVRAGLILKSTFEQKIKEILREKIIQSEKLFNSQLKQDFEDQLKTARYKQIAKICCKILQRDVNNYKEL